MKIAVVQTSYDDDAPLPELLRAVSERSVSRLEGEDVDLIVLPELWAVGAFRAKVWAERAESIDGPTVSAMAEVARRCGAVVHVGAIIERDEHGELHNTAVVLGPDGEVLTTYRKLHLMRAGGSEADLLTAGTRLGVFDLPLRDGTTLRTGLATCYDLRFPELFRLLVDAGAEAVIVPASWPKARLAAWSAFLRARAAENQLLVVGAGAAGTDGRTPMAAHSAVIDATGTELAVAGESAEILVAHADPAAAREFRESFPVLTDRFILVEAPPTAGQV